MKNGEIVDADNVYVNDKAVTSENVHEGDIIVVVRNGSRALIGKHAQIKASMPNTVIGAFMSGMRSEHSSFVNALLDTSAFENEIAKNMGATINQITGYMFSKMEFMIPSGDEQQKIGEHFQSLDNLITLHQRKPYFWNKFIVIDWEQRKLGDVFKEYSEKNHTELPALTIIQGGGTVKREDSDRNLMYDKSNLSNYKMVRKDDFIVHLRSFEGGLEKASSDGIISPAYHTFHSDVADSRFYYPYFRSHEFIKHKLVPHVYGIRDGRSIDIDGMKTIEIPYTSTEEQQKIGDYLESIDHHITLHQRITPYFLKINAFVWEQRKLGDSCKLNGRIGFRGYTEKDIISKEAGGVLTFSPTNIVDNKLTIECKNTYITREKYDESPEIKISNGDILFVKTGSTLGKSALVAGLKEDASINPQIVVMHVEKDTENFMSNVLITDRVMKQVAAVKIGGAVPTMTETELKNFTYFAPAEKEEKKKIGDHFRTLDNLITLHQRKCEETKILKKYMLQKMFPQNGQKVPEIRFKGFTDDWEQRKLGDVLERRIEQRQQSEEYPRLAFASGQGVIPLSERKTNNREQLTKDEYTKKYLVTELNDIVYNPANVKYGAIDRNKCGRGLISPIYVTFTTNEIPGFIERIVTSHDFQQRALRFEEGTVTKRQSVNPEDLVTLDILVAPKREEQQKIATYFDSLDHLITLHQRKCEELQNIKKFMLQNMFV